MSGKVEITVTDGELNTLSGQLSGHGYSIEEYLPETGTAVVIVPEGKEAEAAIILIGLPEVNSSRAICDEENDKEIEMIVSDVSSQDGS